MAIAFVTGQVKSATASSSFTAVSVTLTSAVGSGALVVVSSQAQSTTQTLTSVTDDKSNTYTADAGAYASAGTTSEYFWSSCANITNGAQTFTSTFGGTQTQKTIVAWEFSGGAASSPYDTSTSGTGTGSTQTSTATGTLAQADCVAVGVCDKTAGGNMSGTGGWTTDLTPNSSNFSVACHQVLAATTGIAHTTSSSGSGTYLSSVAVYKGVAGGATRPVRMAGEWGGYAGTSGGFAG